MGSGTNDQKIGFGIQDSGFSVAAFVGKHTHRYSSIRLLMPITSNAVVCPCFISSKA